MSTNECESWWLSALWSLREQLLKMEWLFVCFQVDELYEAFCIQSRLREGAIRMKQAFSCSPSTKGTKESIVEVNRRYKEYTEVPAKSIIVKMKPLTKGCIWAMRNKGGLLCIVPLSLNYWVTQALITAYTAVCSQILKDPALNPINARKHLLIPVVAA